jgi:hypothetical protein
MATMALSVLVVDRSVIQSARRRLLAYLYRFSLLLVLWGLTPVVCIAGSTGLSFQFSCSFRNPADSHDLVLSGALYGTPVVLHIFVNSLPHSLPMVILTLLALVVVGDRWSR